MVDMTDFLAEPYDRATKHAIIVQCKVNIQLLTRKQTVEVNRVPFPKRCQRSGDLNACFQGSSMLEKLNKINILNQIIIAKLYMGIHFL